MSETDNDQYIKFSVPDNKFLKELWYCSSIRGITKSQTGGNISYYGKVIRIPAKDAGTDRQDRYEIDPLTLISEIPEQGEPVVGGTIERYEIWDIDTGDLLVMFRIPFTPKTFR